MGTLTGSVGHAVGKLAFVPWRKDELAAELVNAAIVGDRHLGQSALQGQLSPG